MWQIIKYFRHNGQPLKMWEGRDAEGRRIYSVAGEDDLYEPSRGLYTQKAALVAYDDAAAWERESRE